MNQYANDNDPKEKQSKLPKICQCLKRLASVNKRPSNINHYHLVLFYHSVTMSQTNEIKTLSSGRYLLTWMYLYDKSNFFVDSKKIPDFLIYFGLWFPTIYIGLMTSWNIYENFDFGKIALAAAVVILIVCTLFGLTTLATNTDGIATTIDHLQDFVQKSEESIHSVLIVLC